MRAGNDPVISSARLREKSCVPLFALTRRGRKGRKHNILSALPPLHVAVKLPLSFRGEGWGEGTVNSPKMVGGSIPHSRLNSTSPPSPPKERGPKRPKGIRKQNGPKKKGGAGGSALIGELR